MNRGSGQGGDRKGLFIWKVDRETYLRFVETYGTTEDVTLENEEELLREMRNR